MKKIVANIVLVLVVLAGIIMGLKEGVSLSSLQEETLRVLVFVMLGSVAYCFIVGEVSRNNSQMDKLWSVLPVAYAWIVVAKGGFPLRLVVMALIVTVWGGRLTFNFAKKGAYSIKFWSGEEDYRWEWLRRNTILGNKLLWACFDLFFISFYQNALVLAICLPMVAAMSSARSFGLLDFLSAFLMLSAVLYETVADKEQMAFQTKKWRMLGEGRRLEDLPQPYCLGFNTTGLWGWSRHPNYLAEQATWVFLYLFSVSAGAGVFNWSIPGCLLLILLFMGSSSLGESISSGKYPSYKVYQEQVGKYLPLRHFKG